MENRSPVVGYTCSYMPVEIINAAGIIPRRIIPESRGMQADAYIHPNTCHYLKSLLADALGGAFSGLDGMIFVNSCDGMRKLFDIWNRYIKQPSALFVDLLKKKDADTVSYYATVLRNFAAQLEDEFDLTSITLESLNSSIRQYNEVRSEMARVFAAQAEGPGGITGADVFTLCREGTCTAPAEFVQSIREKLDGGHGKSAANSHPRIVLTGNILNRPEVVSLIENAGADVVALDTCFGRKHYERNIEEGTADPYLAIAQRYLTRPSCARMQGVEDQVAYLKDTATSTRADGVIMTGIKYCDSLTYNVPVFEEGIKSLGAGFLFLENDYVFSDMEKTRIKIEAFLEMMG
jgi:benzoyl-CoA reductase/2-hydroxyglutaryl-CoA dehydratase subunit BcrC/BadD/HgdB